MYGEKLSVDEVKVMFYCDKLVDTIFIMVIVWIKFSIQMRLVWIIKCCLVRLRLWKLRERSFWSKEVQGTYVTIQRETDLMCQNGGFIFSRVLFSEPLKLSRNYNEVLKLKTKVAQKEGYFEKKKNIKNFEKCT